MFNIVDDNPSFILYELHSVYTHCYLYREYELKDELCEIIYQIAAGLFETAYIRLLGIELEVIEFLRNGHGAGVGLVYSFYHGFNCVETVVNKL